MATSEQYAQWIVSNKDKQGTPEFDTVAAAYKESKSSQQEPGDLDKLAYGFDSGSSFAFRAGRALSRKVELHPDEDSVFPTVRIASDDESEQSRKDYLDSEETRLATEYPEIHGTKHAESGMATLGKIVREVADPTSLLPIAPAMTGIKGAMAGAGALGALDSSMYDLEKEGKVDLGKTVKVGAASALFVGAIAKGVKAFSKTAVQKAQATVGRIGNEHSRLVVEEGLDATEAARRALNSEGLEKGTDQLKQLIELAGTSPKKPRTVKGAQKVLTNTVESQSLTRKIVTAPFKAAKSADGFLGHPVSGTIKAAGLGFRKIAQPISTRIADINPKLAARLVRFEGEMHTKIAERMGMISQYTKLYKRMDAKQQKQLDKLLFTEASERDIQLYLAKHVPGGDEIATELTKIRVLLKEMKDQAKASGHEFDEIENYFPRGRITNAKLEKILKDKDKSKIELAFKNKADKKGEDLLPREQADIVARHLTGGAVTSKVHTGKTGHLRKRTRTKFNDEVMKSYDSSVSGLQDYIREVTFNTNKRNFFGISAKAAREAATKSGKTASNDLDNSIAYALADDIANKRITIADSDEVTKMLQARFGAGEQTGHRYFENVRNVFYSSVLGNIKNAVTQLGDIAISGYVNGIGNTVKGMGQTLTGSQQYTKLVKLGVTRASEELNSAGGTAKFLNGLFEVTGFAKVDRFGKSIFINAAANKAQKALKVGKNGQFVNKKAANAFERKYKLMFDEAEYDVLTRRLNGDNTLSDVEKEVGDEMLKIFQFSELSGAQPISKSEMPEAYLANPNSRILFMLKTFTLKQLDLAYRNGVKKIASGNPNEMKDGVQSLVGWGIALTMAGATTDQIKSFIWDGGKSIPADDLIVQNLYKLAGLSQYIERDIRKKPTMALLTAWMAPPLNTVDNVITNYDDLEKMSRSSPMGRDLQGLFSWFK